MVRRFVVRCSTLEGADTEHVSLSTAYREQQQLTSMGHTADIEMVLRRRNQHMLGVQ